jgi:hypothetical protein
MSNISETASEPGSPGKDGAVAKNEVRRVHLYEKPSLNDRIAARCCSASVGLREEEADLHYSNDMDIRHDRLLLHVAFRWTHLHPYNRDRRSDNIVQGSHRHLQRPQPG